MTKVTLATVKSFIRKNEGKLYVDQKSSFDGMVDMVMPNNSTVLTRAQKDERGFDNTMGIQGAWFVLGGGDRFSPLQMEGFIGYYIRNCCGEFILATRAA